MTELPDGWRVARLGEVADTTLGKMLDRGHARGLPKVPYLRNVNVQWGRIDTHDLLTMELADGDRVRFSVQPGDLLVCEGGDIGRAAIWHGRTEYLAFQKALHRIRSRGNLDLSYLRYLLELYRDDGTLERFATGSTIAHLPQQKLRALPVPLPMLDEQRLIVEILEDHLSRLDAAKDGCTAARLRLDALRVSSLSSVLVDREDWPYVALGDALDVSIGGLWGSAPGSDEVDVRVLRVTELKRLGKLEPSTAARRSISQKQLTTRQLQAGDLLLEKSGGGPNSPVGRVGFVEVLESASVCSNFMQLMRPSVDQVIPRFLHLYLNAFHLRGGTAPMQKASTNIRNLKASEYVKIPVPLPHKRAQETAVRQLEVVLEAVDLLESAINQTQARGDALRHALLGAAFSGRLTGRATDMEMAEEMASV